MTTGNHRVAQSCFNSAKRHQDYVTRRLDQLAHTPGVEEFIDKDEVEDLIRLGMTLSSMIDRLQHDFTEATLNAQEGTVT